MYEHKIDSPQSSMWNDGEHTAVYENMIRSITLMDINQN